MAFRVDCAFSITIASRIISAQRNNSPAPPAHIAVALKRRGTCINFDRVSGANSIHTKHQMCSVCSFGVRVASPLTQYITATPQPTMYALLDLPAGACAERGGDKFRYRLRRCRHNRVSVGTCELYACCVCVCVSSIYANPRKQPTTQARVNCSQSTSPASVLTCRQTHTHNTHRIPNRNMRRAECAAPRQNSHSSLGRRCRIPISPYLRTRRTHSKHDRIQTRTTTQHIGPTQMIFRLCYIPCRPAHKTASQRASEPASERSV